MKILHNTENGLRVYAVDIDSSGSVSIAEVQKVINSFLGIEDQFIARIHESDLCLINKNY